MNGLSALGRFVRPSAATPPSPDALGERCRLCAQPITNEHPHLCDVDQRTLLCACPACVLLLGQPGGRYRAVPRRVLVDPGFTLGDADWDALQIPVRLAFLFFNSRLARWVALYPSPAGAAESALPPEAFDTIAARTPLARALEPDVEALLIHGRRGRALETFLVPIDACYRLVGSVRTHWKGFHGGDVAWRAIEDCFVDLRARALPLQGEGRR